MEKLAELFNSILFFIVAYPATLFNALVFPAKVYGSKKASLTCPGGVTLAISFSMFYGAETLLDRIRVPGEQSVSVPNEFEWEAVLVLISTAFMLLLVLGGIRSFRLRATEHTTIEEMLVLSYPISIGLATYALVFVACLAVPHTAISVAQVIDQEFLKVAANRSLAVRFGLAIISISMWPIICLSGVAFFNVLRTVYRASWKKSLAATVVIFLCAAVLFIGLMFGVVHLLDNLSSLQGKS